MNQIWTLQYWGDNDHSSCVENWFDQRTAQQLKVVAKELKLLELCGNKLRLPHSRALGGGLFELRENFYGYRMYYAFLPDRNIVVLQAGDKKSQKNDIKLSRERLTKIEKKVVKDEA